MKSHCDNCGWTGEPKLTGSAVPDPVPDLWEPSQELDEIPTGECPECRSPCFEARDKPPLRVTIEVYGGVSEVTKCPPGVEVEIIDHDNEKHE